MSWRRTILTALGLGLLWALAVVAVVFAEALWFAHPSVVRGAVNQLGHDWVYWETGKMTFEARRQIVYGRAAPAAAAIITGAFVIALWQLLRYSRSHKLTGRAAT